MVNKVNICVVIFLFQQQMQEVLDAMFEKKVSWQLVTINVLDLKSLENNFVKLADMVTCPTNISPKAKKLQTCHFFCKQLQKTMFMLFNVSNVIIVETTISNFQEGFSLISPKLHCFAHKTSRVTSKTF